MISFRSPCSDFATKYNLFSSGVLLKIPATLHFLFTSLDPRSLPLSPAVLNICSDSFYLFFFPHLLSHWLFPTPKSLNKTEFTTLVCMLLVPRSFTFCNVLHYREYHSVDTVVQQILIERGNG